jgi:cholesterol transport system auxiliary component
MMPRSNVLAFYPTLAMLALTLAGCARQAANSQFYLLRTPREAPPATKQSEAILTLPRFTIDAAFAGRGLVYRLDEFRDESDAYNEFFISPAEMITEQTRQWLAQSGLFAQVLGSTRSVDPTHQIEANIIALYGDFRDKDAPKAVVEIRFFFLRTDRRGDTAILLAKPYTAVTDVDAAGPQDLIAGFDRALQTILTEFERDLAEVL